MIGAIPMRRLFAFVLMFGLCGCGPRTAAVTGTVRYKDADVPSGRITFVFPQKVVESEIESGHYVLHDVPTGNATVLVTRIDPTQPDPYAALNESRQRTTESSKSSAAPFVSDPAKLEALEKKRHLLPYVYATPATSPLRYEVKAGANTFDVVLKEDAKAP
jgi:hypothetical protein